MLSAEGLLCTFLEKANRCKSQKLILSKGAIEPDGVRLDCIRKVTDVKNVLQILFIFI